MSAGYTEGIKYIYTYWWNNCLKKTFYNLYQGMLYWWHDFEKKPVYYLYQGMYRCTWFIGEITV
jgi:hypothetical protein